jgi:hypothetical protein
VSGAAAVVALVLLEWTTGWIGAAAWSQSWKVIRRGHFRITAWIVGVLAVFVLFVNSSAIGGPGGEPQPVLVTALVVVTILYLMFQYSNTDVPATVAGSLAAIAGIAALVVSGALIAGWPDALAALSLVAGAIFLGAVINGMMLGHWYLNQPGLKTSALARVTDLALAGAAASGVLGLISASRLSNAATEGAVLGLPGFGQSFGTAFFVAWLVLLVFTGAVLWGARRCVKIKSIQSATGLFYVAVLSAGVAEFLLRYLMVNAA